MLHHEEALGWNAGFCQRIGELARRFVEQLVGQAKCPPMHRHRVARVEVLLRAYGLLRIGMHHAHEPARVIGTDRQHGEIEGTEARADIRKVGRIAVIATEEKAQARMLDDPSPPQGFIAIPWRARTPVLDGCQRELEPHLFGAVPPIQFGHIVDTLVLKPLLQPERHEKHRRPALLAVELADGLEVEVIVVIMRNHDDVGMRQGIEIERGGNVAFRPGERKR